MQKQVINIVNIFKKVRFIEIDLSWPLVKFNLIFFVVVLILVSIEKNKFVKRGKRKYFQLDDFFKTYFLDNENEFFFS